MEKKRFLYLDILKVIAAIFVIYNHAHFYIQSDNDIINFVNLYLFTICKVAVPLFIMTTGVLFLKRETSYKEIFTKRIPRVFIALIIVSMCFSLYKGHNPFWVFLLVFQGDNLEYIPYWCWYIYMLIGLYIMTPFLQRLC